MLKLYYFPGNASLVVHVVLEEIGVPFTLEFVDRAQAAQRSRAYLALNPNGLIPVLVDDASVGPDGGPLVLYETAAICMHLADVMPLPDCCRVRHARAGECLQVDRVAVEHVAGSLTVYFYPERWADDAAGAAVARRRRGKGRRPARSARR